MAALTKVGLSGAPGGRPIKVAATASPGTLIHATGTSSTILDEITLRAHNSSTSDATLTIEFGGVTDPDDLIVKLVTIPARVKPITIVDAIPLAGTGAAAQNIRAFSGTTNVITITGYVNRIG